MKSFFITSLLAILLIPMMACGWVRTNNYYLFNVYNSDDFSMRVDEISRDNWKAYLGMSSNDYFWFNANDII